MHALVPFLFGISIYQVNALQCWTCSSDIDRACADMFNASNLLRYEGSYYQGLNQQYNPYNQRGYDNRDSRNYGRDPNTRDPYFDRDRNRDQYNSDYNRDNNRDNNQNYNRNYNNRDGRDPYFDRDNRDPYNRDPNNRDYPPRDYNRDNNAQGRNYDPNYPPRDYYQRPQSLVVNQDGPRLLECNDDEARSRRQRNVCIKKVQRLDEHQLTYIRRCETVPLDKTVGTCDYPVARGKSLEFCEICEYDGCNSAIGFKIHSLLVAAVPLLILLSVL